MQEENIGTTEVVAPVDPAVAATVAPVVEAPTASVEADPGVTAIANGKNVIMPQHTLGKLKQEQRERGKREAMTEFEAKFKAAGFSSLDDAIAAIAAARNAPAAKPPEKVAVKTKAPEPEPELYADEEVQTTAQPQGSDQAKQMQRLLREREKLAKQFAAEQSQRRKLQRQLEAKEAEFALRETAVGKGVKDVDYALRLIQRELESKDEKALAAFDEAKFFDNLRASHPYLFGEMVVPATTGTGVGAAPAAPKATTVQQAAGQAGKADARSLSADEFQKLVRSRGFSTTL